MLYGKLSAKSQCLLEKPPAPLLVTHPDLLSSVDELERHYGIPSQTSRNKTSNRLTPDMQQWLLHSPFFLMATTTHDTLDCSPRGDRSGQAFRVLDEYTIAIPDRRGNNRIETLRNLVRDPRIGLLFMVPGVDDALRIKGNARISINEDLLNSFVTEEEPAPRTVMLVSVISAYVQNARAIRRAGLWNQNTWHSNDQVPNATALSSHGITRQDSASNASASGKDSAADINDSSPAQ